MVCTAPAALHKQGSVEEGTESGMWSATLEGRWHWGRAVCSNTTLAGLDCDKRHDLVGRQDRCSAGELVDTETVASHSPHLGMRQVHRIFGQMYVYNQDAKPGWEEIVWDSGCLGFEL